MNNLLEGFANTAYVLLRIVSGVLFLFHGVQKIFGVMTDHKPEVFSQLWIGGLLELVCGTLIAVGVYAAPAAFVASGMMAVAYIQFHWKLQFGAEFFPAVNKGELALLYCFLFLYIACRGSGTDKRASRGR
jgi:putative oxidoreductase